MTLRNVPAYRYRKQVPVEVPGHGVVLGDIAWGGNWFFLVSDHGHELQMDNVEALTDYTWAMLKALEAQGIRGADGALIDHIELFADDAHADSRNFVMCPGKAYDRSPAAPAPAPSSPAWPPTQNWPQENPGYKPASPAASSSAAMSGTVNTYAPSSPAALHMTADSTLLIDEQDPFAWGI